MLNKWETGKHLFSTEFSRESTGVLPKFSKEIVGFCIFVLHLYDRGMRVQSEFYAEGWGRLQVLKSLTAAA